ncbi:MAG: hypothetical protein SGCHY_002149 [Lobulomycetales sp.]
MSDKDAPGNGKPSSARDIAGKPSSELAIEDPAPSLPDDLYANLSKASPAKTASNIMKTIIGAGIFSTAYAVQAGGFFFSLILILLLGLLFYWTIMTLIRASVIAKKDTAQEMMVYCFGKAGEIVINITLLLNSWGTAISYSVIIGDVVPDVLRVAMGEPQTEFMRLFLSRRGILTIVSLGILLPVSLNRGLASLSYFSAFALLGIFFIIVTLLALGPSLPEEFAGTPGPLSIINFRGIHRAIGVFSFAYVCHQNLLLNYHQMQNTPRKLEKFASVAKLSMALTVAMTCLVGCTWFFVREKAASNILNSYPVDWSIMVVARLFFGIDMFFSYPLDSYVIRDTLQVWIWPGKPFSKLRHSLLTLFTVLSTLLIASLTCDLGIILELTGGVAAALIAFIIPSACYIKACALQGVPLSKASKAAHYSCIAFGVVVMTATVVMVVLDSLNDSGESAKSCNW